MMQIIKEKLEIDEALKKKINNLLKFNNIKANLETGRLIFHNNGYYEYQNGEKTCSLLSISTEAQYEDTPSILLSLLLDETERINIDF